MASIDFLWKQYLSSEGYSSLRDALLDQTGLTNGQVDFLWCKYLEGEGYSGSLPAMMYNWLRDKGYSGSLPYMMYRALEDGNVFGGDTPPIGCSITLTGDAATAFGLPAADINGQTFSITDAAAAVYLASTSISNRRSMPASGKKVWVQGSGTGADVRFGFVGLDASGNAIAVAQVRTNGSAWALFTQAPAGDNEVTVALPAQSDSYSIGVGSDGEVYIYRRDTGTVVNVSAFGAPSGLFASAASLMLLGTLDCGGVSPATMSGTITTDADSMTDAAAFGGDEDWCGNEIPASPAPDPDPLPEFTFTLSMFENGSIVNNPGVPVEWEDYPDAGAWWHNDYVPPSVITVDEPDPVMSTSELAAWVEPVVEDADAQDGIPDGTEIGIRSHWWKWYRKPAFFKMVGSSFVYYETLAEALADVSSGDMLLFSARTWDNTGGEPNDPPGPRILTSIAVTSGEFEVAYTSPFALFVVGEAN